MKKSYLILIAFALFMFSCSSDDNDALTIAYTYSVSYKNGDVIPNDTVINTGAGLQALLERLNIEKSEDVYSEVNGTFSNYSIVYIFYYAAVTPQGLIYNDDSTLTIDVGFHDTSAMSPKHYFIKTTQKIPSSTKITK